MRNIAPSQGAVHFVLCDFGQLGLAYVETEPVTTESDVVDGILTGEYDTPVEVMAVNLSEGCVRDVAEDVAGLVFEKARSEHRSLAPGARAFIQMHLDEELEPEFRA